MMKGLTSAQWPMPEVSVVIPRLNEEENLGKLHRESATSALRESGIKGEVVVADNGSNRCISHRC